MPGLFQNLFLVPVLCFCCINISSAELSVSDIEEKLKIIDGNEKQIRTDGHLSNPERHKENMKKFDDLRRDIHNTIIHKINNADYQSITPFLKCATVPVRDITINSIENFLLNRKTELADKRRNLFDFYIENCKYDNGLLFLKVCSKVNTYEEQLKKNIKRLFLKKQILPLILEFKAALFFDTEIIDALKRSNKQIKQSDFNKFSKSKGRLDFKTYVLITNLVLSARHGNEDAFKKYDKYANASEPISPKSLIGYAIIASSKSYDILFEKQNDFRKYSYTKMPVANSAAVILHKTIEGFPYIKTRWLSKEDILTPGSAQKYLNWIQKHRNSYKLKKLNPYELYSLLSIRIKE